MKKIFLLILLAVTGITSCYSQKFEVTNTFLAPGEKLTFTASYYMSGLYTDLAQITMHTIKVKTKTSEYLRLKCTGSTYSSMDSFFKIRDLYESYVNPITLKPSLFKRAIDEGGYVKNIKYKFNRKNNIVKATTQRRQDPEKQTNVKITSATYDLVSVLYVVRGIDYKNMQKGQSVKIMLLIDSKLEYVNVKFMGIENINSIALGTKKCFRLSVSLKDNSILKGKDANNIWFTADRNRVPVLIKAKIPVGNGQIRLTKAEGLKYK